MLIEKIRPLAWDERRQLIIPGDHFTTIAFCVEHFIAIAQKAIEDRGYFFVALSGGSTPKAIFERLSGPVHSSQLDWSKVFLFWSDERSVPPDHAESNYFMAMEAGLKNLPIPPSQIFRMRAEENIEQNALAYENILKKILKNHPFDLIMLGMGEDGHTASLFPHTEGLHSKNRSVIANFVPQINAWRMTMTFEYINSASHIAIYVLGASKKHMLANVLLSPEQFDTFPSQKIGTKEHPALWIADEAAAALLIKEKNFHK